MGIKVSVIMPSLNVADYIEEAVESVRNQALREIEIICIDAGSDDGTWEILSGLARTDERMVLCHSDQKSYGYQVNLGIDMAKGEYVAILETDDHAAPEMYEALYQEASLHDCDYVKSDYLSYWTQDDGNRFFVRRKSLFDDQLYGMVIEPKRYWETATEDWYLWSGIYKKDFLDQNNIRLLETPGAAFQDIGFLYQVNVKAKRGLYLKDAYYRYCMDRADASSNTGKGLLYAYHEYGHLCSRLEDDKENDLDSIRSLYCRMAKSFMCCCEEMGHKDIGITDKERGEYYQWFRTRLKNAVSHGIIGEDVIRRSIWEKVEILLGSDDICIEDIRARAQQIKVVIGEPGQYSLVIFGCGFYGYNSYRWLKRRGYKIKVFMDNNKTLWGMRINGIPIEDPQQAGDMQEDTRYLIANEQYGEEIKKQLLEIGVSEPNICKYTPIIFENMK